MATKFNKGFYPYNVYHKDLVWGVFKDGDLCGAFETKAEAENYVRLEEEEDDSEYTIVYSED